MMGFNFSSPFLSLSLPFSLCLSFTSLSLSLSLSLFILLLTQTLTSLSRSSCLAACSVSVVHTKRLSKGWVLYVFFFLHIPIVLSSFCKGNFFLFRKHKISRNICYALYVLLLKLNQLSLLKVHIIYLSVYIYIHIYMYIYECMLSNRYICEHKKWIDGYILMCVRAEQREYVY